MQTYRKNNRFVCAYSQDFLSKQDVKKVIRNLNDRSVMRVSSSLKELARSWRVETDSTFDSQVCLIGCRQAAPHTDLNFEDAIFITLTIVDEGRHILEIGNERLGKDIGYSLSIGSLIVFDPCAVHVLYDDMQTIRKVAPQGWAALQIEITKKEFKAITKNDSNENAKLLAYSRERFSEFLA